MQEVPECPEYDIHIPNGRFLVSILVILTAGLSLDDADERNCDYLVAINFFTAYRLQLIGRLKESLNFVAVAERMLFKLLSSLKPENKPTISARQGGLELIHEEGTRSPAESQGGEVDPIQPP